MGDGYNLEYSRQEVRASLIMTTSYVVANLTDPENTDNLKDISDLNQIIVIPKLTFGSLTSAEVKIEFSSDGTNWYQETSSAVSSGTVTESLAEHTFGATGNYRIAVPVKDRYTKHYSD